MASPQPTNYKSTILLFYLFYVSAFVENQNSRCILCEYSTVFFSFYFSQSACRNNGSRWEFVWNIKEMIILAKKETICFYWDMFSVLNSQPSKLNFELFFFKELGDFFYRINFSDHDLGNKKSIVFDDSLECKYVFQNLSLSWKIERELPSSFITVTILNFGCQSEFQILWFTISLIGVEVSGDFLIFNVRYLFEILQIDPKI